MGMATSLYRYAFNLVAFVRLAKYWILAMKYELLGFRP